MGVDGVWRRGYGMASQSTARRRLTVNCAHCGAAFGADNARRMYCSQQCKMDAWVLKRADQLPLRLETVADSKHRSLTERYAAWRELNPHIYELFKQFALEAWASGSRVGAKAIAERIRWELRIRYRGDYKVNNSFVSRMARELIEEDERFVDWFETRRLRA